MQSYIAINLNNKIFELFIITTVVYFNRKI